MAREKPGWIMLAQVLGTVLSHLHEDTGKDQIILIGVEPEIAPAEIHKHCCRMDNCRFIWEHPDYSMILSDEQYHEMHNCPKCEANTRERFAPERGRFGENEDGSPRSSL